MKTMKLFAVVIKVKNILRFGVQKKLENLEKSREFNQLA